MSAAQALRAILAHEDDLSTTSTGLAVIAHAKDGLRRDALTILAADDLLTSLTELLEEVDFEVEQRQNSGNAEDWAELQAKSDRAHAAVRKARGDA